MKGLRCSECAGVDLKALSYRAPRVTAHCLECRERTALEADPVDTLSRDSAAMLLIAALPVDLLAQLYLQALAMTCAAGCDGNPTAQELAQDVAAMMQCEGYSPTQVATAVAPLGGAK